MYILFYLTTVNKYACFQEKRIYDLKKKNQELEKFKFVLDYKIKELKKQIEPRENDIKAMKEQIQEVGTFNVFLSVLYLFIDSLSLFTHRFLNHLLIQIFLK